MMELTNGARLGIAMMGLGCARRALVEALCYARAREAFGAALIDQPLPAHPPTNPVRQRDHRHRPAADALHHHDVAPLHGPVGHLVMRARGVGS